VSSARAKPTTNQTRGLRVRAEHLLPLACAAGCAALAASEFMNTFELNGPGPTLQAVQSASDQHHFALLVLAGFALVALGIAIVAGSKPAATAVAICGAMALLIFLLIDLPDAGNVGTINEQTFTQAKADPTTGFWLELAGGLVLAVCGGALATLSPEQLRTFARAAEGRRPSARWRPLRPTTQGETNPGEGSGRGKGTGRGRGTEARTGEP
jgi:hypothetical protein